jgi:hypothetical protein
LCVDGPQTVAMMFWGCDEENHLAAVGGGADPIGAME